jgi:hypothetical protein
MARPPVPAASWLVAAVLAIAGLALVAGFFRVCECPDCGGYLRVKGTTPEEEQQGWLTHRSDLGCPRCGDQGKVSWFNSRSGAGVDPDVARLARVAVWPHADPDGARQALENLAARNGEPRGYLTWVGTQSGISWEGRFARSEGVDYFIAALTPNAYSNQEAEAPVRLLLLSLKGEVLDRLDGFCPTYTSCCTFGAQILPGADADGAWIQVDFNQHFGSNRDKIPFRILRGGQTIKRSDGEDLATARGPGGGFRVRIRSGQFVVLKM